MQPNRQVQRILCERYLVNRASGCPVGFGSWLCENARSKAFGARSGEMMEASVARYLQQLDTADRQEPSEALATKITGLREKIAKLGEEMQRLQALEARMLATPDQQISLTGRGCPRRSSHPGTRETASSDCDLQLQQNAPSASPAAVEESYHRPRFYTARVTTSLSRRARSRSALRLTAVETQPNLRSERNSGRGEARL